MNHPSQNRRISIVPNRATGCVSAISTDSSIPPHSMRSTAATCPLVSADGPSVTDRFPEQMQAHIGNRTPGMDEGESTTSSPNPTMTRARGLSTAGIGGRIFCATMMTVITTIQTMLIMPSAI